MQGVLSGSSNSIAGKTRSEYYNNDINSHSRKTFYKMV